MPGTLPLNCLNVRPILRKSSNVTSPVRARLSRSVIAPASARAAARPAATSESAPVRGPSSVSPDSALAASWKPPKSCLNLSSRRRVGAAARSRDATAAKAWTVRSTLLRRRRGYDADRPPRAPATPPRRRRGPSAVRSCDDAAATTRTVRSARARENALGDASFRVFVRPERVLRRATNISARRARIAPPSELGSSSSDARSRVGGRFVGRAAGRTRVTGTSASVARSATQAATMQQRDMLQGVVLRGLM